MVSRLFALFQVLIRTLNFNYLPLHRTSLNHYLVLRTLIVTILFMYLDKPVADQQTPRHVCCISVPSASPIPIPSRSAREGFVPTTPILLSFVNSTTSSSKVYPSKLKANQNQNQDPSPRLRFLFLSPLECVSTPGLSKTLSARPPATSRCHFSLYPTIVP